MNQQTTIQQNPPPPQPPELRLDFYDTAVIMSQWQTDGYIDGDWRGRIQTYPIDIHDLVGACTQIEMRSGLLPANTLFWRKRANQTALAVYVPARRWKMQTAGRAYHLPMPPFVFMGCGRRYRIFGVKKRPLDANARLYHTPAPNVYGDGGICAGNTPFPACSAETIRTALTLFMEDSYFNADLRVDKCLSHKSDVRQLWDKLDGKKRFPLKELVPMNMRLQDLL